MVLKLEQFILESPQNLIMCISLRIVIDAAYTSEIAPSDTLFSLIDAQEDASTYDEVQELQVKNEMNLGETENIVGDVIKAFKKSLRLMGL